LFQLAKAISDFFISFLSFLANSFKNFIFKSFLIVSSVLGHIIQAHKSSFFDTNFLDN
jgi:hypothetical protein